MCGVPAVAADDGGTVMEGYVINLGLADVLNRIAAAEKRIVALEGEMRKYGFCYSCRKGRARGVAGNGCSAIMSMMGDDGYCHDWEART